MNGAVRLSAPSIRHNGVRRYSLSFTIFKFPIIQGDSEEKVSVLGGDNIRHCEKNGSYGLVSSSEWLQTDRQTDRQTTV